MPVYDVPKLLGDERIATAGSSSLVEVYLPQRIKAVGVDALYPDLLADPGKYTFFLDLTEDCQGAGPCDYARLVGKYHGKVRGAREVTLTGGVTGRYTPSRCGANCSLAQIQFRVGPSKYVISAPSGRRALVRMANSALKHGPR